MKPTLRPAIPNFSSGPCAKRPGYSLASLATDTLGRSHRSGLGKARLAKAIAETRAVLGIPADYKVGIVPASDTGAFEMAMWNLLGARGVDAFCWESFGEGWVTDIQKQLKLADVRLFKADYGHLPDLTQASGDRDVVFTWNGTTSGVKVPDGEWIRSDRKGLTLCDATSAVFAMDVPWAKLDAVTFSWQKVLGGEAAHGMLVLSPRAVERLTTYKPVLAAAQDLPARQGRRAHGGDLRGLDHQHALDAGHRGLPRRARLGEVDRRPARAHRSAARPTWPSSRASSPPTPGSASCAGRRGSAPTPRCASRWTPARSR